jgi:uncharacterized membrane protein
MKSNTIVSSALASLIGLSALTVTSASHAADAPKAEKCYGIAKAGKNDCQTSTNACSGQVKTDRKSDAWIFVPTGTCARIVGASLQPKKS